MIYKEPFLGLVNKMVLALGGSPSFPQLQGCFCPPHFPSFRVASVRKQKGLPASNIAIRKSR